MNKGDDAGIEIAAGICFLIISLITYFLIMPMLQFWDADYQPCQDWKSYSAKSAYAPPNYYRPSGSQEACTRLKENTTIRVYTIFTVSIFCGIFGFVLLILGFIDYSKK
jgi:hypothetical protein